MMDRFNGFKSLVGEEKFNRISNARVMLVGLGGVGSWCFEGLVRSGVKNLSIVDLDEVCISNTNRQLQAIDGNFGKPKGQILLERAKGISPEVKVNFIQDFYTPSTSDKILEVQPDIIIDAIDGVDSKCHLIIEAKKRDIPIIVIGASAGKQDPSCIRVDDLSKSFNDRLLFLVRKKLRHDPKFHLPAGAWNIRCVFSSENSSKIPPREAVHQELKGRCDNYLGSACFLTAPMGFAASYEAIKCL